jgi:hypothetical protein
MLVGGDRLFFILVHALTLAPNQFSQLIKWREVKSNSCAGKCAAVFVLQHPEMTKVALGKCVKAEKHKSFCQSKSH